MLFHSEIENKTRRHSTQEFLQNLGYTKVTSGNGAPLGLANETFVVKRLQDDHGTGADKRDHRENNRQRQEHGITSQRAVFCGSHFGGTETEHPPSG